MRLEDRVAVIAGGSAGIGKATAMLFANEGAKVVMAARTQPRLADALKEVQAVGEAIAVEANLQNEQDVQRVFAAAIAEFGKVDIAVPLAHNGGPFPLKPAVELSVDEWNDVFVGNTVSSFLSTREALKHMIPAGSGTIVTFSSSAADLGNANRSAYSAAKAAVAAFTRAVAREVGQYNVRINCISPVADSEGLHDGMSAEAERAGISLESVYASMSARTPLGRVPTSEDVAYGVLFLASDESRAITGQVMDINCGSHMR